VSKKIRNHKNVNTEISQLDRGHMAATTYLQEETCSHLCHWEARRLCPQLNLRYFSRRH
jgi:hypothetical protein